MAGMRRLTGDSLPSPGKGDFTTFLSLPIVKTQMFLLSCLLAPLTGSIPSSLVPALLPEPSGSPPSSAGLLCHSTGPSPGPFARTVKSCVYKGQGDSRCLLPGLLPSQLHIEKPAPPKAGLNFVADSITPDHTPNEGTDLTLALVPSHSRRAESWSGGSPSPAPALRMRVLLISVPTLFYYPIPALPTQVMSFR